MTVLGVICILSGLWQAWCIMANLESNMPPRRVAGQAAVTVAVLAVGVLLLWLAPR